MAPIFRPSSNTIARVILLAIPLGGAFVLWLCLVYTRSSYGTGAGIVRVQPVPFSHQHHVGDLGIDCRYCHTSVEHAPNAGLPPHGDVHELPLADLGRQRRARPGARELPDRQVAQVAARL